MRPGGTRATPPSGPPRAEYDVTHPLCRIHPRSGRPALCVAPLNTWALCDTTDSSGSTCGEPSWLDPEASQQLLDELLRPGTADSEAFSCRWKQGTLVAWDNRAVTHLPRPLLREPAASRATRLCIVLTAGACFDQKPPRFCLLIDAALADRDNGGGRPEVVGRRLIHRIRMNEGLHYRRTAEGLPPTLLGPPPPVEEEERASAARL